MDSRMLIRWDSGMLAGWCVTEMCMLCCRCRRFARMESRAIATAIQAERIASVIDKMNNTWSLKSLHELVKMQGFPS